MSDKEFEKVLHDYISRHVTGSDRLIREIGSHFYEVRQAEIDALKAENRGMADLYQKKVDDCAETEVRMHSQICALKDQVRVGKCILEFQEAELQRLRNVEYVKIGPYE